MLKKFLIPCMCIISIGSLAGCAKSNDTQAMTALNNQVERVQSIVSSTNINEIAEVSPSVTLASDEPYNSIQSFRSLSNENMLREEEIRQNILKLSASLKNHSTKKYKLNRKKANAIKEIAGNLSKYASQLNETKSRVKYNVGQIKKNLKVHNINIESATSSYITLNNNMNERYAYLCNIYDNLEQACIILDCNISRKNCCKDCQNDEIVKNEDTQTYQNSQETILETDKGRSIKNIDNYKTNKPQTDNPNEEHLNNQNIDTLESTNIQQPIPNNPLPYKYHNNWQAPYYNNYPNSYYNNRFNPGRNTDSYYSFNKNIDTYRFNPNVYNYPY